MNTLIEKGDPITERFVSGKELKVSDGANFVTCIKSGIYITKGFKYVVVCHSHPFITIKADKGKVVKFMNGSENFASHD